MRVDGWGKETTVAVLQWSWSLLRLDSETCLGEKVVSPETSALTCAILVSIQLTPWESV